MTKLKSRKPKLLHLASKNFFVTSSILILISAIALFFYTKSILKEEIEEELFNNWLRAANILEKENKLINVPPIIEMRLVKRAQPKFFLDTLMYDPIEKEVELFKQLVGTKSIDGNYYKITTRSMKIDSEDIFFAIVLIF